MNYPAFLDKAKAYPLFKVTDAQKWFPQDNRQAVLNQLHLWTIKGYIQRIRRGIYMLSDRQINDQFVLASFLYGNSYVSTESALNSLGLIPDIPFGVTCVSLAKTKTFYTKNHGVFIYQHIHPKIFFGFSTVHLESNYSYNIAIPEKALFDYFYLTAGKLENPEGFLEEMRLSLPTRFDYQKFKDWSRAVSPRKKTFHTLIKVFLNKYAK